jgi:FAD/FMN-containing dehydrogenase
MGLTGIILRVAFRLQRVESGWLRQRNFIAANLNEALDLFEQHQEASYSVAWIDCLASGDKLGRSILMLGEHAAAKDIPLSAQIFPRAHKATTIPFTAPAFALNSWSMRAFNEIFYQLKSRQTDEVLVRWDDYFYPLDKLLQWNRLYGRKGFLQFQCVLPLAQAGEGLSAILKATASAQQGSFLAVLKRLGEEGGGLSFPMAGYTLALDFPVSDKSLRLLDRLDEIVISYGGRFYLAKDARMESDSLTRSDPRSLILKELRRKNEFLRFHSLQSERLKL